MTDTKFMDLKLPIVGSTVNYVELLTDAIVKLDTHEHFTIGARVNQSGVKWTFLDATSFRIVDVGSIEFSPQESGQTSSVYVKDNDLYYTDTLNNEIRITKNGLIDSITVISGFTGDFTHGAYVQFQASDNSYTFYGGTGVEGRTQLLSDSAEATTDVEVLDVVCSTPVTVDFQSKVPKSSTYNPAFSIAAGFFVYFDKDGLLKYTFDGQDIRDADTLLLNATKNDLEYVDCGNAEIATKVTTSFSPFPWSIAAFPGAGTIVYSTFNRSDLPFLFTGTPVVGTNTFFGVLYAEFTTTLGQIEWYLDGPNSRNIKAYFPSYTVISKNSSSSIRISDFHEYNGLVTGGSVVSMPSGVFSVEVQDASGASTNDYTVGLTLFISYT
jgi:hypothetical protein